MPFEVGEKALKGEPEQIGAYMFEMKEDMIMTFEGRSCNIFDAKERVVEELGAKDGEVTREVPAGYRCYVMKAKIKFEKKSE